MAGRAKTMMDLKDRTTPERAEDIFWLVNNTSEILMKDPLRLSHAVRAISYLPDITEMSKYKNLALLKCLNCFEKSYYKTES